MTDSDNTNSTIREAVALFSSRESLQGAIDALIEAGFERSDLSVLSSHDSIEAAEEPENRLDDLRNALGGDLRYLGPLAAAGFIMLAAGPMAAVLAAVIAAGIGGMAAKELLDETTSAPHAEDFARALEAGAVIIWVRAANKDGEARAIAILEQQGGTNAHMNERRLNA